MVQYPHYIIFTNVVNALKTYVMKEADLVDFTLSCLSIKGEVSSFRGQFPLAVQVTKQRGGGEEFH